jgi:hypothetical protein
LYVTHNMIQVNLCNVHSWKKLLQWTNIDYAINKECEGELTCMHEKMRDREMLNLNSLHNWNNCDIAKKKKGSTLKNELWYHTNQHTFNNWMKNLTPI